MFRHQQKEGHYHLMLTDSDMCWLLWILFSTWLSYAHSLSRKVQGVVLILPY